jgi:hypothetical protein
MEKNEKREKDRDPDIWLIRDSIEQLEAVKDEIAALFGEENSMWISDAKECYYNMVAAWEMLNGSVREGKENYATSCRTYLELARSRMEQVASELKTYETEGGLRLETALREVFEVCFKKVANALGEHFPRKAGKPEKAVVKLSEHEFLLPCAECGEVAASFAIGKDGGGKKETLRYSGITHRQMINMRYARTIFSLLERGDIDGVHRYTKKKGLLEYGIDSYCPECKKVYCTMHYSTREFFDEGFYDYTEGTCPRGHTRIIDD